MADSERKESFDSMYRILMVGDSNVGKTALMKYYTADKDSRGKLENNYHNTRHTMGFDIDRKTVTLSGGKIISLTIVDTCVNIPSFQWLFQPLEATCLGVLLVFDLTDRHTFDRIDNYWIPYIKHERRNVIIYLIGNKGTLMREVRTKQGQEMANEHGIKYYESYSHNVDAIFMSLLQDMDKQEMKDIDAFYQIRLIGLPSASIGFENTLVNVSLPQLGRNVKLRIKRDDIYCSASFVNRYKVISCDELSRIIHGVFLLYDVTSIEMFQGVINYWMMNGLKGQVKCVYIIGLNSDKMEEREVSIERAQLIADELGMNYFEIPESTVDGNVIGELTDKYMTLNYSETS